MLTPSQIHYSFTKWGINPLYGWEALELQLDDLDEIRDYDHLRQILASTAADLIAMAVDDLERVWSSYFTWAVHILGSKMPMTHPEMTMCLGEAARWYRSHERPDYLSVVQDLIKGHETKAVTR